jgi:hypothetical protein
VGRKASLDTLHMRKVSCLCSYVHSETGPDDSCTTQNTVDMCRQITIFILYTIRLRLLNFLKFIFTPLEPSNILLLTVFFFELINFSFQAFPTYILETYTIFSSALFSLFPLICLRLYNHCSLARFPWWKFIEVRSPICDSPTNISFANLSCFYFICRDGCRCLAFR